MPEKKRPKKENHTPRTIKYLRDRGYLVAKLEHFCWFSKRTKDVWGADIIAFKEKEVGALLVQATSWDNIAHRKRKVEGIEEAVSWVYRDGDRIQPREFLIVGWKKAGKFWRCKIVSFDGTEWREIDLGL